MEINDSGCINLLNGVKYYFAPYHFTVYMNKERTLAEEQKGP